MIEELWKNYDEKRTSETRDELIMACLPYIKSSAYRLVIYASPSQDVDDLINAGIIGLMDALEKYDPAKGSGFKNYTKFRIRGSIMDEIRSMDWVPYSTREKARKIEKEMKKLEESGNEAPDDEDLAKAVGMSLGKFREALLEISRMTLTLLQDSFYDGDMSNISEDVFIRDPETEMVITEMENILGQAIERLPEKERFVVTLYYYEEMTMKEIGQTLNISESRVCQIHSSAIIRLHTRLKYADASIEV